MNDTCPKCGCDMQDERHHTLDVAYNGCVCSEHKIGGRVCLRNQVSQRDAEIERLRAENEALKSVEVYQLADILRRNGFCEKVANHRGAIAELQALLEAAKAKSE